MTSRSLRLLDELALPLKLIMPQPITKKIPFLSTNEDIRVRMALENTRGASWTSVVIKTSSSSAIVSRVGTAPVSTSTPGRASIGSLPIPRDYPSAMERSTQSLS